MDILFDPEPYKDIRVSYPELNSIPEFKPLSPQEMRFVWAYALPSFNGKWDTDRARMGESYYFAFGEGNSDIKQRYVAGNMPEQVKIAIERMKKFNPSARMRAKDMVNNMFTLFETMTNRKDSDFIDDKTKEFNASAFNSYVNSCEKVSSMMPKIIEQLETGFGVEKKSESETFKSSRAIDRHHDKNK